MSMNKTAIKILFLLFTINLSAANNPEKRNFGKELFPLSETTKYIYETSFGETTVMAFSKNGKIETRNEADNFKYHQKLSMNSEGIFVNQTYQRIKLLLIFKKENTITYQRPLLRYSFPMYVGKQWKDETIEYIDGDSGRVVLTAKVTAFEEVKTKAGNFNALKIETIVESANGSKNIITEWIAENSGLIKARIEIAGGGVMGWARDLLGYGILNFELKEVKE